MPSSVSQRLKGLPGIVCGVPSRLEKPDDGADVQPTTELSNEVWHNGDIYVALAIRDEDLVAPAPVMGTVVDDENTYKRAGGEDLVVRGIAEATASIPSE